MSESKDFNLELAPGAVKAAMAGVKSADLWKVPRDRIKVIPGFNVRVQNDEHLEQIRLIAESMKANGYFADKPLAGYVAREDGENMIYVTDGHTRLEAVDLANSEGANIVEIPVVTKPAGTSMEDLTVALVVSNEGRNLTPYEVAVVCKRLIGYGMPEDQIARRIGKTRAYVGNLLTLVAAPRAVTNMVQDGKVSATLAVQALKEHGTSAAQVLGDGLKTAQEQGKSKVTGKHLPPKPQKVAPETPPPKADKQPAQAKTAQAAAVEVTQDASQTPAAQAKTEQEAAPIAIDNAILQKGLQWIRQNDCQGFASLRLLAFLSGTSVDQIEAILAAAD